MVKNVQQYTCDSCETAGYNAEKFIAVKDPRDCVYHFCHNCAGRASAYAYESEDALPDKYDEWEVGWI